MIIRRTVSKAAAPEPEAVLLIRFVQAEDVFYIIIPETGEEAIPAAAILLPASVRGERLYSRPLARNFTASQDN